jgi:hypothetical protein
VQQGRRKTANSNIATAAGARCKQQLLPMQRIQFLLTVKNFIVLYFEER